MPALGLPAASPVCPAACGLAPIDDGWAPIRGKLPEWNASYFYLSFIR